MVFGIVGCSPKEELIEKSGLNNILYAGTQNMETYSRFMVIGLF